MGGPTGEDNSHTTMAEQGQGGTPSISGHLSGLCPAKNVGAFPFVSLSQQHMLSVCTGMLRSQEACRRPPKPPAGDEEMDIHA